MYGKILEEPPVSNNRFAWSPGWKNWSLKRGLGYGDLIERRQFRRTDKWSLYKRWS